MGGKFSKVLDFDTVSLESKNVINVTKIQK